MLKKCLVLERDPGAGTPLLGSLIGYRRLIVGNRDWRIVWRVVTDDAGDVTVDVAEVWAAGARSDEEVYHEMTDRLRHLPSSPATSAFSEVVGLFATASGVAAQPETGADPLPRWLRDRLVHTAGRPPAEVDRLSGAEAADLWDRFMLGER